MPNYNQFQQMIDELTVDTQLKQDFSDGLEFCREFAMCMPVHKLKDPIAKELGYTMAFMKCMDKKKMKACMKHDIRNYGSMFGSPENLMMAGDSNDPEMMMQSLYMFGSSMDI